jgi:ABC-type multidrug transport system fused ATPase/permease subunit
MVKEKEKANPVLSLLREEWRHLGNRRKAFFLTLGLFVIAQGIALMTPLILGVIFNSVQQSITTSVQLRRLIYLISLLLVVKIGFWFFHGIGRYVETMNGFYVNRNYVNSKIGKVLNLPISWHKDHHSGDTIDKINKGASGIHSFSSYTTFQIIYAVLNIFGSLAILVFVDYKIAVFALIYSVIVLSIMFKMDNKLIRVYKELNKKSNRVSAGVYDYVSNIITVVTLRLKGTVQREINFRLMESESLSKRASVMNESKWGFASIAISVMVVVSLSFKAYSDFTTTGIILVGTLYILYGYLNRIGDTFYRFAELYGSVVKYNSNLVNARPIDEAHNRVEEEVNMDLPRDWKNVEFKNIDFSYNEDGSMKHMDDVNFKFRKGEKIALVGESGSGKSTMLTLLRGLYSPDSGKIYCNGEEIDHGFSRLGKHVTLISQEPEIFNDTIKNNITMNIRVLKNDFFEVVDMAELRKVINKLDKGIDTNVMEKGVSLSGGEKQRLSLARGLLAAKKSEIVLLDEPTSSVDSENEMKIHDNIFSKFKDKTIISSIHRLHLLDRFDYIYLFENGKIVAEGNLIDIKKNPKFDRIWKKYGLKKEM